MRLFEAHRDISNFANKLITTIEGNYNNTPFHDLARIVWPEVNKSMTEKRKQELKKLDEAIGMKRLVAGIEEVWKLALQNRGELLVVEEGYQQAVQINQSEDSIAISGDYGHQDITDDLVDDIAEKVVSTGGRVIFAKNGSLQNYDHIALILKY